MSLRVTFTGKVKHFRCGSVAKASLNRAQIPDLIRDKSVVVDAKPCDLPMGRLKFG